MHSLENNVMICTECNFLDVKCYSHLAKLQQDWVDIMIHYKIYYAQCLLFLDIPEKSKETIQTFLYKVWKAQQYALVHFMQYNIFQDDPDVLVLYGCHQDFFSKMKTVS